MEDIQLNIEVLRNNSLIHYKNSLIFFNSALELKILHRQSMVVLLTYALEDISIAYVYLFIIVRNLIINPADKTKYLLKNKIQEEYLSEIINEAKGFLIYFSEKNKLENIIVKSRNKHGTKTNFLKNFIIYILDIAKFFINNNSKIVENLKPFKEKYNINSPNYSIEQSNELIKSIDMFKQMVNKKGFDEIRNKALYPDHGYKNPLNENIKIPIIELSEIDSLIEIYGLLSNFFQIINSKQFFQIITNDMPQIIKIFIEPEMEK